MTSLTAVGRLAGTSLVVTVSAVLTAFELVVAVVLLSTADWTTWNNWPLGLAYIALIGAIGIQGVRRGTSLGRIAVALLVLDLLALPVAIAVLSM